MSRQWLSRILAALAGPGAPRPAQAAPEASCASVPLMAISEESLRRLIGATTREARNVLVAIRTFSQLLPERWNDPEFRGRFAEGVDEEVRRLEQTLERLAQISALGTPERKPVDVASLLEELLEERRGEIQARRLVVLRELDREHRQALGDAAQLRFALGLLLEKVLASVPERGDLYLASGRVRHDPGAAAASRVGAEEKAPRIRILLRWRAPAGADVGFDENALTGVTVDAVVRAQGGALVHETIPADETTVLIELPAP